MSLYSVIREVAKKCNPGGCYAAQSGMSLYSVIRDVAKKKIGVYPDEGEDTDYVLLAVVS